MIEVQPKTPLPVIEFGVATLTMAGEPECSDLHVVKTFESSALVAAIDGMGHGDQAVSAAKNAVATIESQFREGMVTLVNLCHQKLKRTRGVVISLAWFDGQTNMMTWVGVGNVEGLLLRANPEARPKREIMFLRGGVVGYKLPPLRPTALPVHRGDLLILTTDGIRMGFAETLTRTDTPQQIAAWICSNYGKNTDDGLALVVRYVGCGK